MSHSFDNADKHRLLEEELLTFARAARTLPRIHGKKHPAPATIRRWATDGRRSQTGKRVFLEHIRVGGTSCTSTEALTRFFARLNDDDSEDARLFEKTVNASQPADANAGVLLKKAERAKEELRRRGLIK